MSSFANSTETSRTAAELRESEQRFRATFFQAAVGIAQTSVEGEWLLLNDRFCEVLGCAQAELRGKTFLDIAYPDDREAFLAARRRLLAGEISTWSIEMRCIRKGGATVWTKLSTSLVRDQNKLPQYFILVIEDVTDRIEAERALRDTERRLALAQGAAQLGVWDWDLLTNAHMVYGEYLRLYGLTPDRPPLTYEEWLRLVHPDDRQRVQVLVRESIEQTHVWDTEFRVLWPDGSVHWLLGKGRVFLNNSGRPVRMTGVNLDITERKQAEAALRESEERRKEVFENTSDGIFLLDVTRDGRFKFADFNPAEERAVGYSRAEISGRFVEDVTPAEVARGIIANYRRCLEGGTAINYEEELNLPTGHRYFHTSLIPVRDADGRIHRIIGIARDITERKRAEGVLRESEERFRNMANTAPVMIWISGPDKRCTFFNKGWLDFTGRSMEQEVFNGWAANVHPDDLDYCLTAYSSAFDARRGFQMECRLRRADGEYRWILGNGVPLHTAGEFTGFIGSCIDVTERKLVEDRLRTSEARLMDAQRLAKIGSWERSIDGADVAYWSHEMFRIFGRPIGALPSFSDFISYVHPDDREKMRTTMQQARTGTAPVIVEFRIFRPDGEVRCLRSVVELIRNDQGVPVRVAGATQDVTDQVKARELLRESEERLKSAQRLAHVGNWDWDIKENRLFWSEEIYRIFGRPRHYTPHYEDFLQAIQPQDRERVSRRIRDALGGQIPQFLEFQISRPDGDARTVACMSEVLRDDGGLPVRMIGACLDVTDQKCAEAALRRSLDEIAHLNRVAAMGELTASLAHELNQPLAAILSNAQAANRFLGSKPPDVAQASACLTDIIADDKRAGEVIKRLRGLLRKEEFQASLVDLNEIVSDAIRLVGNDALLRKSSLKFEPFPHLPLVPGDRIQIYQVVLNLVMNALEAAAERPPGDRWVLVRTLESEGGRIELTVEDSGGGIAENDLARVFEPFFSTKPEGLGMGLSISRSIVRAHGGRIWADNNARGSAIFHFVLPLTQEAGTATA